MSTTAEEILSEIEETDSAVEAPEEQAERDPSKIDQRKPPKDGLCRRCGQNKPVNRLMLCYPCWVKSELEKTGWREGLPHPDWCACDDRKDHPRLSNGN